MTFYPSLEYIAVFSLFIGISFFAFHKLHQDTAQKPLRVALGTFNPYSNVWWYNIDSYNHFSSFIKKYGKDIREISVGYDLTELGQDGIKALELFFDFVRANTHQVFQLSRIIVHDGGPLGELNARLYIEQKLSSIPELEGTRVCLFRDLFSMTQSQTGEAERTTNIFQIAPKTKGAFDNEYTH